MTVRTYNQPISQSLTSFKKPAGKPAVKDKEPVTKDQANGHQLPVSNWKELQGSAECPLKQAIERTRDFFFREQLPDGYWWAELESNVTITAEYIMLFHFLGNVDKERERKLANYLLREQKEEGYWSVWYNGPGEISASVESYFALKLAGFSADHPAMIKARKWILDNGGIIKTRIFTRIFLAQFGEFSWRGVPSMPVELMLLPDWAWLNIYEFASWARSTIVPLSVIMADRPVRPIPESARVQELYVRPLHPSDYSFSREEGIVTLKNFFIGLDHILKIYEASPVRFFKKTATKMAEDWILEHQEETGDWGGIQPAMQNSIMALHCLGYANDHPVMAKGLKAMEDFCIANDDAMMLQSCISPVWDTALTLMAMQEAGVADDHPSMINAAQWLLNQESRIRGDWKIKSPELEPSGWSFEFTNTWYPDVDDSAAVMIGIRNVQVENTKSRDEAIRRGLDWCLGMQSANGGWAAFDKDNTKHFLNKIPFADLEALIDPPTADLTGRMLEMMGYFGYKKNHFRAITAIEFLRREQEPEGCWFGRWGVNYIYGTWYVLVGLESIGEDMSQHYIKKATNWIKSVQNPDGGWGEVCDSYCDRSLMGCGPSTASQTAWALMALMAGDETNCQEVERGVQYLLSSQNYDGSWDEDAFTGTGFPKYFMIKYHAYRNMFPLMALGRYGRLTA